MLCRSLRSALTGASGLASLASGFALESRDYVGPVSDFLQTREFLDTRLAHQKGDIAYLDRWLPHDEVVSVQEQFDDGVQGELQRRFKPAFVSGGGCYPYPAVDHSGFHGEGLKPVHDPAGHCHSTANLQMYTRLGQSHGRTAIMYTTYSPKIQTSNQHHKHQYNTLMVWLHADKCNPDPKEWTIAGVSYSTWGGDENKPAFKLDTRESDATTYMADTQGTGDKNTHAIIKWTGEDDLKPSEHVASTAILATPCVSWSKLSAEAVAQFDGMIYEKTFCPFNSHNYQKTFDAAWNPAFYARKGPSQEELCAQDKTNDLPPPPPDQPLAPVPDTEFPPVNPSPELDNPGPAGPFNPAYNPSYAPVDPSLYPVAPVGPATQVLTAAEPPSAGPPVPAAANTFEEDWDGDDGVPLNPYNAAAPPPSGFPPTTGAVFPASLAPAPATAVDPLAPVAPVAPLGVAPLGVAPAPLAPAPLTPAPLGPPPAPFSVAPAPEPPLGVTPTPGPGLIQPVAPAPGLTSPPIRARSAVKREPLTFLASGPRVRRSLQRGR